MNRSQAIISGTLCALVLGSGVVMLTRHGAAEAVQYKTATAEIKDLRQTVSATGTVQPFTTVDIKSRAGGEIKVLAVDVGDRVKKGQLIARIDPTDSQTALDQAVADVSAGRAKIQQSQETLALQRQTTVTSVAQAEAQARAAEAQVRSAQAQVAAAQARLTQAKKQSAAQPALTDAAIRQARAGLETAEKTLAQLTEGSDPQARQDAASALSSAKANLKSAQANLENARQNLKRQEQLVARGFVAKSVEDTARTQVASAQADVDTAQANLASAETRSKTIGAGQEAAIAAAQARVTEAKAAVRSAEANRVQIDLRKQDVANAEAALMQANAGLAQATAGLAQARANLEAVKANRMQINIRANDVATAQAQIARSEAQRKNAATVLAQTTITAPSDGVILQKYMEQGTIIASAQSFSAGAGQSIVQLGDLSRIYVDALVDETDISSVKVGQKVTVLLDAIPDKPFKGRVMRVDPRGVTDNNITTIKTRIELSDPDPALRPGLNGECEFMIAEKKDVLVIPSRAVKNDKGRKFVQVLTGDEKDPKVEQREITIGMETNDSVEVTSGLKRGEKVVTATITPGSGKDSGGKGGPGGGFGGNGGGGMGGLGGGNKGGKR